MKHILERSLSSGWMQNLSKLQISEEEKESFGLDAIIDFVEEIAKLDLPEEDESGAVDISLLREDEVEVAEEFDALANAPRQMDGCYLAPLVVE